MIYDARWKNYVTVMEFIKQLSMDWFKGKIAGKPHMSWKNIYGFL